MSDSVLDLCGVYRPSKVMDAQIEKKGK
jgi:hypothetical protein